MDENLRDYLCSDAASISPIVLDYYFVTWYNFQLFNKERAD